MASRDLQVALLGLAKALESGVDTYQRRRDFNQRLALAEQKRKQDLALREENLDLSRQRHEDTQDWREHLKHLNVERLGLEERKEQRLASRQPAPKTTKQLLSGVGEGAQSLLLQRGWLDMNPSQALREALQMLPQEEPQPPDSMMANPQVFEEELRKFKEGREVLNVLRQLERDFQSQPKPTEPGPMVPRRPPGADGGPQNWLGPDQLQELLQQTAPQGQQTGMAAPGPIQPYSRVPRVPDMRDIEALPQGPGTLPGDQKMLGKLFTHYGIIKGYTPATPEQIAESFSWIANFTPAARLPMDIEMMATGAGGGMPT